MNATLTSKGQLTLPKAIRDELNLQAGAKFKVEMADGRVSLTPLRLNPLAVRGILKSPHARPLSIKEMDEGITQELTRKHRPSTTRT